jgi:hypothetical protein
VNWPELEHFPRGGHRQRWAASKETTLALGGYVRWRADCCLETIYRGLPTDNLAAFDFAGIGFLGLVRGRRNRQSPAARGTTC